MSVPSDRLFHCLPTPTERAGRKRAWKAQQGALLDVPAELEPDEPVCPACAGIGPACTCARTGAVALALVDDGEPGAYLMDTYGRRWELCPACGGSDGPNVVGPCSCEVTP